MYTRHNSINIWFLFTLRCFRPVAECHSHCGAYRIFCKHNLWFLCGSRYFVSTGCPWLSTRNNGEIRNGLHLDRSSHTLRSGRDWLLMPNDYNKQISCCWITFIMYICTHNWGFFWYTAKIFVLKKMKKRIDININYFRLLPPILFLSCFFFVKIKFKSC